MNRRPQSAEPPRAGLALWVVRVLALLWIAAICAIVLLAAGFVDMSLSEPDESSDLMWAVALVTCAAVALPLLLAWSRPRAGGLLYVAVGALATQALPVRLALPTLALGLLFLVVGVARAARRRRKTRAPAAAAPEDPPPAP